MEDLVAISNEIKDKYNLSFGNSARNGKILIQNNKYKFYLHNQKNSEILKFRCNHYKNPNKNKLRCEAYFTISENLFTNDFNPYHTSHDYDENSILH